MILIVAAVADPAPVAFLTQAESQVIIGALVVFLIIFVDYVIGFVIGLSAIVIYARIFKEKYGISTRFPMSLMGESRPYITPKDLQNAQDNVVGEVKTPYKGIPGVYSAQGLDSELPGIEGSGSVGQDF
jgi:hypothetical protein